MEDDRLKQILEAALLAAGRPLSIGDLETVLAGEADAPPRDAIRRALSALSEEWAGRSLALQEVASGFRAQIRTEFEPWVARLWEEKPPRYSRALLETLAIIAYRQPITRSEIEEIRGVSVSTQIMRTLGEREWVRVVGHRDAPGKPAMYGTTRQFLDHFNLKSLDQLPPLSEIRELGTNYPELAFEEEGEGDGPEGEGVADTGGGEAPETSDSLSEETRARSDSEETGTEATDTEEAGSEDGGDRETEVSSAGTGTAVGPEEPASHQDDANPRASADTKTGEASQSGNEDPEDPACMPVS